MKRSRKLAILGLGGHVVVIPKWAEEAEILIADQSESKPVPATKSRTDLRNSCDCFGNAHASRCRELSATLEARQRSSRHPSAMHRMRVETPACWRGELGYPRFVFEMIKPARKHHSWSTTSPMATWVILSGRLGGMPLRYEAVSVSASERSSERMRTRSRISSGSSRF